MPAAAHYAPYIIRQDTLIFALGVLLILGGMVVRLTFSHHWMQAEERAKDGWLNEDQARRRIALLRYSGPVMIGLGTGAFVVLFWR